MTNLTTKGIITNEFGEKVGSFWYRPSMMAYTLCYHGIRRNGWTLEGIQAWADSLEYYIDEA